SLAGIPRSICELALMAAVPQTKLMTADEFCDWASRPENHDRFLELERGEVIELPPPGARHGVVCGIVSWLLGEFVHKRKKGYVCTNDTGVIVERDPDTVRGADVALYDEVKRYEEIPAKLEDTVPALVVEVLSPNDRWSRTMRRITEYL